MDLVGRGPILLHNHYRSIARLSEHKNEHFLHTNETKSRTNILTALAPHIHDRIRILTPRIWINAFLVFCFGHVGMSVTHDTRDGIGNVAHNRFSYDFFQHHQDVVLFEDWQIEGGSRFCAAKSNARVDVLSKRSPI